MANDTIHDAELGTIAVRRNARARRFIFRTGEGQVVLTAPVRATMDEIRRAIDTLRPRLREKLQESKAKAARRMVTPDFRIDTEDFTFHSEEARVPRMMVRQQRGSLTCYYPAGSDFTDAGTQRWIVSAIEESLRQHARVFLPPRLREMARARGLAYRAVSIHKTHGRWGSCSTRGNINLSLYLLLLPRPMQDLVMQHELTHLVEMNHSPRFHQLLDQALGGREQTLERELKRYDTSIFTLT